MTQHSLIKAFNIALFLSILTLVFPSHCISQANYGCPITIDGTENIASIRSAANQMSMVSNYATPFENLINLRGKDFITADVTMEAKKSSDLLYLNDFGFSLPEGTNILGVEVTVTGKSSIPGVIRDTRLSLASGPGMSLGKDKANRSLGNKPWGEASSWSYGSVMDDWGTSLSPSVVNNPGFGILIQISNRGVETVTAAVDQIAVRIYYQSSIEICGHPCIALQSFEDPNVTSYSWNVDSRLRSELSSQHENIINVFTDQAPLGEYQICLTRNFADGSSDNCCRPLHYKSCETGSIGDRIWEDTNGNGLQDPGEQGLNNCTVRLYDTSGKEIANTISVNGNYNFTELEPGGYIVQVDTKGYATSGYNGENLENNSDIENIYFYGSTDVIHLGPGENRTDIDLGLTQYGSICGHAFNDRDGDGWKKEVDVAFPGIVVNLYDNNCVFLRSVTTDLQGDYCFNNVPEGSYYIAYELPEGYFPSSYGFNNTVDPITGKIRIDLGYGDSSSGNDLGAYRLSDLGGSVWNDENGNGIRDLGEMGIADVEVALYDCNDQLLRTVLSDANGDYAFLGLSPGEYKVCIGTAPLGYSPSVQSNIMSDGCTDCIELLDGETKTDTDLALIYSVSNLGGLIWVDANDNGILDPGEGGIANVTVVLQDCSGNIISETITAANGNYLFEEIPAGDYQICLTEDYLEYESSLTNGCSDCFGHTGVDDLLDMDFSLVYDGALVDAIIWLDANADGVQDDNEELVSGILTELYTCDGTFVSSTVTDSTGGAWFLNVRQGEYYIKTILNSGYEYITNGGDVTDQNGEGTTDCFTVQGLDKYFYIGLTPTVMETSLDAVLWEDINENSILDIGETTLESVTVGLYSCQGILIEEATSASDGTVSFTGLAIGDYYIQTELLPGLDFISGGSITNQYGPGSSDCFTLDTTGQSLDVIYLTTTQALLSNITGSVWLDKNMDGMLDNLEIGMQQVEVKLYDEDFLILKSTTTNELGSYSFLDLNPGPYYVQFLMPDNYKFTSYRAGINSPFDSEVIDAEIGMTDVLILSSASGMDNINAGLIEVELVSSSVAGRVWIDEDSNGLIDTDESGWPESLVLLFEENGTYHSSTFTDEDGNFTFSFLPFGKYYLDFDLPIGYNFSPSKVAGISLLDSEVEEFVLGTTGIFQLQTAQGISGINAGFQKADQETVSISGRAWLDADNNSLDDTNEVGYADLLVTLYDEAGVYQSTSFTDEQGYYNFIQLDAGQYFLQFELPEGYQYSNAKVGSNDQDSEVTDLVEGTTGIYNLVPGDVLDDIHVGLQELQEETASIAGRVWVDADKNNLDDGFEQGFSEMLVLIFDNTGTYITSTSTDQDGNYQFGQLVAGSYYLDFELPDGYTYSLAKAGGNAIDSEVSDRVNGTTEFYTLSPGETREGINAGLQLLDTVTSSIEGIVWVDGNDNNVLDVNEAVYPELLVMLTDEAGIFVTSTFTDQNGRYFFSSLNTGSYYVDFDLPEGYTFVEAKVAGTSDFDSEVTEFSIGLTDIIVLSTTPVSGINAGLKLEAALEGTAVVSGRVWRDTDMDGLIGITESGIEGVKVELVDDTNQVVESVATIWSGHYEFTQLNEGLYYVRFELQGDSYSEPNVDGSSNRDSEVVNALAGNTNIFYLDSGEQLEGVNAGMIKEIGPAPSSIKGIVWLDTDEDGLIGNSELGLSGVEVSLINDLNETVSEITTSLDGTYEFNNLDAGLYYVKFAVTGYEYTLPKVGGASDDDSEVVNSVNGNTILYIIEEGQELVGINAGLKEISFPSLGSITGRVWFDEDENGIMDAAELGADKQTVVLFDDNNDEVARTETEVTGIYDFSNLEAGLYYVKFEVGAYDFTIPEAGGTSIMDSEVVNAINGNTPLYILLEGEDLVGVNAGIIPLAEATATISGMAWVDSNLDGLIDVDEQGAANVIVNLIDVDNEVVAFQTTSDDGLYEFSNLVPGLYYFRYDIPDNSLFTIAQAGGNSDIDSDVVNVPNANTALYVLVAGQELKGINAGIYQPNTDPVSISGTVWNDEDKDGFISATETGLENVAVELVNESNVVVVSVLTDVVGAYSFENMDAGLYYVRFDIPEEYYFTTPQVGGTSLLDSEVLNFSTGKTTNYVLSSGDDLSGVNAGVIEKEIETDADISGIVWEDINGNGILDSSELGSSGIAVRLLDSDNNLVSIVSTNGLGEYSFAGRADGDYFVQFTLPLDSKATSINEGGNLMIDSDIEADGKTNLITLSGANVSGLNAGYYYPVSIGDWVWLDLDEDGMQSPDEPGANNYIVNLYDGDNNFISRVWSNYNENGEPGFYNFNDLIPGEYYIKITPTQGIAFSLPGQTDDENDSDLTGANGLGSSDLFSLNSGETTTDKDIGLILAPATLGDRLWIDENGNGIQDDSEDGLDDVTVELYNAFDILVGTTVTSSKEGKAGYYLFEDIYPTEYYVKFVLSAEYITTVADIGGVDSMDSDIDNSNGPGTTSIFLLSPGETDLDIDGGIFYNAYIGDKVWHDRNKDGILDSNEPGVEDVIISLYKLTNGEANFVATTVSDRLGEYRFANLANGDYYLIFEPTLDFEMTALDMGSDDDLDSDADKTGVTGIVTISNNNSVPNVDVGLIRPDNQLSGFAWLDLNKNGTYEDNEAFVEGITIWLMKGGIFEAEAMTSAGGRYLFDDLSDDDYYLKVDLPSEYDFTTPNFGIDEKIDSDFDYSGNSETFTFTGDDVFRNINLGLLEILKKKSIVYPNPLIGSELNVSTLVYKDGLTSSYKLVDNMGQVVMSGELGDNQPTGEQEYIIPTDGLQAGVYVLKLYVGREVENLKFTKISR